MSIASSTSAPTRIACGAYESRGGDSPVDLTGDYVIGGELKDFLVGSSGNWVLYRADQDVANRVELYAAPATGGPRERINGEMPEGSSRHRPLPL